MITLQKGAVYKSRWNGMVEYIGLDRFHGETTHKFRRLAYGGTTYIQPEQLDEFLAQQETLETVKQQRDELLAATKVLLEVLNKYGSTTSNIEVVTSADEEIAAAYRQARKAISSAEGGAS